MKLRILVALLLLSLCSFAQAPRPAQYPDRLKFDDDALQVRTGSDRWVKVIDSRTTIVPNAVAATRTGTVVTAVSGAVTNGELFIVVTTTNIISGARP